LERCRACSKRTHPCNVIRRTSLRSKACIGAACLMHTFKYILENFFICRRFTLCRRWDSNPHEVAITGF
jgi:hypothetical protein